MEKIRGVNLGGWLVLEKWLTPSVFAGTDADDEYALMRTPQGKKRLRAHRNSFVTEADFHWLAKQGVDLVRIPVGYWLFEPTDGFEPCAEYLDKALGWANNYGIRVLIDLHAARGSQNGFDSSGRTGAARWFDNPEYQEETILLLERIAARYKDVPALWGIELLNEPLAGWHYFALRKFYRRSYKRLCRILRSETHVVFHDAFKAWLYAGTFWKQRRTANHPIVMDVHWYVSPVSKKSVHNYLRQSLRLRKTVLRMLQLWHPVLIGEWSSVLPQRFFDTAPQSEHNELLRQNIAMQQAAHNKAIGTVYWNYKAEGGGMWSYRSLTRAGVISKD